MTLLPSSRGSRIRLSCLLFLLFLLLLWSYGWVAAAKIRYAPVEGDILFQSLPNGPGLDVVDAIEGATDTPYSHCGVVVSKEGQWYVLEAMVPTVQEIPLGSWVQRGGGRFAAYRLKEQWQIQIPAWIQEMRQKMGRAYDYRYRMEDDEIYCSELPFDAWKTLTGEDLGRLLKLGDLKWQKYRQVILAIEGSEEVPVDRVMITPRDLAEATQLKLVLENGLFKKSQN